ncbi:hypothetical protein V8C86DRAFT_242574 [Haematococcus lacustris]
MGKCACCLHPRRCSSTFTSSTSTSCPATPLHTPPYPSTVAPQQQQGQTQPPRAAQRLCLPHQSWVMAEGCWHAGGQGCPSPHPTPSPHGPAPPHSAGARAGPKPPPASLSAPPSLDPSCAAPGLAGLPGEAAAPGDPPLPPRPSCLQAEGANPPHSSSHGVPPLGSSSSSSSGRQTPPPHKHIRGTAPSPPHPASPSPPSTQLASCPAALRGASSAPPALLPCPSPLLMGLIDAQATCPSAHAAFARVQPGWPGLGAGGYDWFSTGAGWERHAEGASGRPEQPLCARLLCHKDALSSL